MASTSLSEKIRRAVSQAPTDHAVSELAASLQAADDDLVLCFADQTFTGVAIGAGKNAG